MSSTIEKDTLPIGNGGRAGGGRTASIVSQMLLNDPTHQHMPAGGRLSVQMEMPEAHRIGIGTVTKEEIGFFRKAIPSMSTGMAWLCLFLNVILPGSGTLVSSIACLRGAKTKYKERRKKAFFVNLLAALLQFLTLPIFLIGLVWSILWGVKFVRQADGH